jgi:hypothetical protein
MKLVIYEDLRGGGFSRYVLDEVGPTGCTIRITGSENLEHLTQVAEAIIRRGTWLPIIQEFESPSDPLVASTIKTE